MPRVIQVQTPSRLHFGLLSIGSALPEENDRRFGGVGVMIDSPPVALRIASSDQWRATGIHAIRVRETIKRWIQSRRQKVCSSLGQERPPCHIHVDRAPPQHVGLGVGTQLALSAAAGLETYYQAPPCPASTLAAHIGRGQRSAVGTHGFALGGLIIETGKTSDENVAPLYQRIALPDQWRIVLFQPSHEQGLFGDRECAAFRISPGGSTGGSTNPLAAQRTSRERTQQLLHLAQEHIAPCAAAARFQPFSQSVYAFGRLAGEWFAHQQGGPFNGRAVTELIDQLRSLGVSGVGQSSWGPTVFAFCRDQGEAETLVQDLSRGSAMNDVTHHITAVNNRGAEITKRTPASHESWR